MGMGYCRGRRTEGSGNKVLISPVWVRWLNTRNEYWKNYKDELQAQSLITATKHKKDKWTQEEYEFLYTSDHIPAIEVARILRRSFAAVKHKRRKKFRQKWAK